MRWLFIGIAAMALGLVVLGTLGQRADDAPVAMTRLPGRYVEIVTPEETAQRTKGAAAAGKKDRWTPQGDPGRQANQLPRIVDGRKENSKSKADEDLRRFEDDDKATPDANGDGAAAPSKDAVHHWQASTGEEGKRAGGDEGRFDFKPGSGTVAPMNGVIGGVGRGGGGSRAGLDRGPQTRRAPARKRIVLDELAIEGNEQLDDLVEVKEIDEEEEAAPAEPEVIAKLSPPKMPAKPRPKPTAPALDAPPPPPAQFGAKLVTKSEKKKARRKRKRDSTRGPTDAPASTLTLARDAEKAANFETLKGKPLPARLDLGRLADAEDDVSQIVEAPPERFLPRMCYFENTYLGGNAAYLEQLRRVEEALGNTRPLAGARLEPQAFDPPQDAGIALSASLDRVGLQQPGRVVLQVGLQGSQRYGWRRPPLDVVLVVDAPAAAQTKAAARALIERLSPRDRLGVIRAGEAAPLAPVAAVRATRDVMLDAPDFAGSGGPAALARAMDAAGGMLTKAAGDAARVPGSQTVILLTHGQGAHAEAARSAAHRLQVQGAVVSVIDLSAETGARWWAVANAGHGNFHRASGDDVGAAVDAELASLSKVVARLLRLNVRLGPQAEGVRVIGSRILGQREVKEVKAREVATDRNLSKTMGVKANRGDDDDGIQTVIPYFYGGDSHVVLIELWIDPAKARPDTAVAEISLKYKDMVNLDNATARTAVYLGRRPAPDTPAQRFVKRNLAGFAFAAALDTAADHAARSDWTAARRVLRNHAATPRDRAVARAFDQILGTRGPDAVAGALRLASRQRKGTSAPEADR